jgi:hypothetical protein
MSTASSPTGIRPDQDRAALPHPDHGSGAGADGRAPVDPRACRACPHATDAHDALGTRFCAATTAGGQDRGCICSAGTARPS